ncbi:radical SAM protein [Congzhengia minquanensis]|uniref:Radical SAM protein n=1 Tax=Congzhengia minquanensis TaxID=2763657 RepID=A0A926DKT6_9FIRM|nr:radical SAM protein [Congzhengia minquanensis]MBC8540775.1 radical SAM protein [Congzhengia minquanensis]
MELLGRYVNGNVRTMIFADGTKVRETDDDEFMPAYAENIDIKICNRCDRGCKFCHEGSTPDGKLGDILNENFVDTLHPYQEVALGGGNVLEHPDLISFLQKLKERKVIANITLNQVHFEKNIEVVENSINEKLIYGLGVSLVNPTSEFIEKISKFPNAVIHVINGILKPSDVELLGNKGLKMLILGYKNLRRGSEWLAEDHENIVVKQMWLKENLADIVNKFKVLSFDNLAIEQLDVQRLFTKEKWDEFYAGDDGKNTYYIDMVERKFARSSTAPFNKRYDLMDSVDEMFTVIRKETKK